MNKIVKRTLQIGVPLVIAGALLIPRLNLFSGASSPDSSPNRRGASQGALPVTGIVARSSVTPTPYLLSGTFYPNEEIELVSETVGKVVAINFDDGDRVKKGDLLVKVDDSDLQAQLQRALHQKELQEEKLKRQQLLLGRESVSYESFQEVETDYNVLLADIELLRVKIARTEIRAPFDGQMGFRYISIGSYVQPSTKIATLTDNSYLKLEFSLPEKYQTRQLLGRQFTFYTDAEQEPVEVEIYAVSPQLNDILAISVRGRYKNTAGLLPGSFLNAELTWDDEEYILVPTEAVVPEMEGQRVWIAKNGKAKSVPIQSAGRSSTDVEVTSGISVGDTVLVNGLMQLREGMAVNVSLR